MLKIYNGCCFSRFSLNLALKRLINKFDEIAINLYLKKQQKQG
jgi:hypothetical protein